MKIYLNYFKVWFITNLQYRSAAIAGILTQFFFGLVSIFVYLAFFESNHNVNSPISFQNLITYLWLQQAFYAIIYPINIDNDFVNMIKNGNIAYEFVRPENIYIKYFIKMSSKKFSHALLRFPPIIIIGLLLPEPFNLSLPYSNINLIIFILALIFSTFLISAFSTIIHMIIFFTIDSKGIFQITGSIVEIFMGSIIPIPLLPKIFRNIAYILPFRFICDLPFRVYSNDITYKAGIFLLLQSILWTFIFIIIGLILAKFVKRKAVIQGG